ncbi:MAG: Acetyltransferase family [Acidimicrobiaceae bacterium]|jgi:GNAT superfamily N-acetyltransferase
MSPFSRLRRGTRPAPHGPITYQRLDIMYKQLTRRGWPRQLQTIRQVLPAHLHDSPPNGAARIGLWTVSANVADVPVGLAWAVHPVADQSGAYIEEVAVLESHQRQGIGTRLLYEVATWMTEIGRPHLRLLPITSTQWVIKAGFRASEHGGYEADAQSVPDLRGHGRMSGPTTS